MGTAGTTRIEPPTEPIAFSPGPWRLRPTYLDDRSLLVLLDANEFTIADIYQGLDVSLDQWERDATLLAHAPRMLELVRILSAANRLHIPIEAARIVSEIMIALNPGKLLTTDAQS